MVGGVLWSASSLLGDVAWVATGSFLDGRGSRPWGFVVCDAVLNACVLLLNLGVLALLIVVAYHSHNQQVSQFPLLRGSPRLRVDPEPLLA